MTPAKTIAKWKDRLGLQDWDIRYSPDFEYDHDIFQGAEAYIHYKKELRMATIRVIPEALKTDQLERLIVHEMCHLVFNEFSNFAYANIQNEGVLSFLGDQEEYVINRFVTAMTQASISPVQPLLRKNLGHATDSA